ncbi:replication protein [Candidatus Magnetominusculus xianensis]|uniref:replication protein n=1 Tax=Candidatus Magnetominusculus xianensis TaxID=1748249 RepID=UPI0019F45777|nr:replication protein [Candidatus Magnetominusculus xianensis]MBF0405661.1 replication protein [Nitrospirota bacterium]
MSASKSKTELRKTNFSINMIVKSWKVEFHEKKIQKQIKANLYNNTTDDIKYYTGYCRIPNTMMNGLISINFSARESRVFWTIISRTWSWRKPAYYISYREIANECAMDLHDTHTSIQHLIDKNIIISEPSKRKTNFAINQHADSWQNEVNRLKIGQKFRH